MKKKLDLTDSTWFYGSYPRVNYKKDMLYTFTSTKTSRPSTIWAILTFRTIL